MNERFLFEPSLAFCLLAALLIVRKVPAKAQLIVALVPLLIFAALSFNRSFAWKDNFTLFTTDVKTSGNSIKGLMGAGGMLYDKALITADPLEKKEYLDQSILYLERSITLMPTELNNYRLLGRSYFERDGIGSPLVNAYLEVFRQSPGDALTNKNVETIVSDQRYAEEDRLNFGLSFMNFMPGSAVLNFRIGTIYGQTMGDIQNSIAYLQKAVDLSPNNPDYLKNLGTALAISGDFAGSVIQFEKVIKLSPNDKQVLSGLALSYQNLGNQELAAYYQSLADQ